MPTVINFSKTDKTYDAHNPGNAQKDHRNDVGTFSSETDFENQNLDNSHKNKDNNETSHKNEDECTNEESCTQTNSIRGKIGHNDSKTKYKVFIGGLISAISAEDIKEYFLSLDFPVIDVDVIIDRETKMSKNYGFASFPTAEIAEKCIAMQHEIKGKVVDVKHSRSLEATRNGHHGYKFMVAGLPNEATTADVENVFKNFGFIVSLHIPNVQKGPHGKRAAYVVFAHTNEAARVPRSVEILNEQCDVTSVPMFKVNSNRKILNFRYFPRQYYMYMPGPYYPYATDVNNMKNMKNDHDFKRQVMYPGQYPMGVYRYPYNSQYNPQYAGSYNSGFHQKNKARRASGNANGGISDMKYLGMYPNAGQTPYYMGNNAGVMMPQEYCPYPYYYPYSQVQPYSMYQNARNASEKRGTESNCEDDNESKYSQESEGANSQESESNTNEDEKLETRDADYTNRNKKPVNNKEAETDVNGQWGSYPMHPVQPVYYQVPGYGGVHYPYSNMSQYFGSNFQNYPNVNDKSAYRPPYNNQNYGYSYPRISNSSSQHSSDSK